MQYGSPGKRLGVTFDAAGHAELRLLSRDESWAWMFLVGPPSTYSVTGGMRVRKKACPGVHVVAL